MNSLNDFWRAMFGEDISNFEEMLMIRGAWVMTPEEPLYAVFAMMVRVLNQSQGEAEKALLKFAPELVDRARSIMRASDGLDRQLALLQNRADEFSGVLRMLEGQSVNFSLVGFTPGRGLTRWIQQNIASIAFPALVLMFCVGFVMAAYLYAR